MKKSIFTIGASMVFVLFSWQAGAQCIQNVTFQPKAGAGDDVMIVSSDGCIPSGGTAPDEAVNFYGAHDLQMSEWTIHALGCNDLHIKTLIRFDQMVTLPPDAIITHASLLLNGIPTSLQNSTGNSWYPGTPYSDNAGTVNIVDGGAANNWVNNLVTWNTAPAIDAAPISPIPVTTTEWNNPFNIDVTSITQQIYTNMNTLGLNNNGYLLSLNLNTYYRNTMWASSFNPYNPGPALYIEYYVCNANFDYCSSTQNPNTYNFTAVNPTSCYKYVWQYGDGSPNGSGTASTHTYTAPGTYTACLLLIDSTGVVRCEECATFCIGQKAPVARPATNKTTSHAVSKIPAQVPVLSMDNSINIKSVSPNPAQTQVDVNMIILKGGSVHYTVYDMQGKVMAKGDKIMTQGAQKFAIDVNKFNPGSYLLVIQDANLTTATSKFTKE
ncbi:MAG: PKD domain-containing protein [Flavipsychrobacter sp.]|nr:PKD domain-containing protein [Flavipsychrobacter sp.]